jgi:mRNA interferase HigB
MIVAVSPSVGVASNRQAKNITGSVATPTRGKSIKKHNNSLHFVNYYHYFCISKKCMKAKIYRLTTIEQFKTNHANARLHCDNFLRKAEESNWTEPHDITQTIKGNLIGDERVVFDLGGNGRNAFRMICKYDFKPFQNKVYLFICWMGSHEEYNNLSNEDKLTMKDY